MWSAAAGQKRKHGAGDVDAAADAEAEEAEKPAKKKKKSKKEKEREKLKKEKKEKHEKRYGAKAVAESSEEQGEQDMSAWDPFDLHLKVYVRSP